MKYLIIGAGGTGGVVGYYMTKAGKDVTLIARGAHLKQMQTKGLILEKMWDQSTETITVKTSDMGHYTEQPDVILVCVKGYSLADTIPFIQKVAKKDTVVIPILNIYGTGEKISRDLPGIQVLNGCIYISAAIEEPGVIRMSSDIFRIVYGRVDGRKDEAVLYQVEQDLKDAGITPLYTDQIRRDTLQKYAMVSPMAAVGAFYDVSCGKMQESGEIRDKYIACIKEIDNLANAMGIPFPVDVVETNVKILDDLPADCTASMQKDLKKGGKTEMDGLIFEMVRMGHKYGVPVPNYEEIAAKFGYHYDTFYS